MLSTHQQGLKHVQFWFGTLESQGFVWLKNQQLEIDFHGTVIEKKICTCKWEDR